MSFTIESVFNKNLYSTLYDYQKIQGVDGAKPRTYEGTVLLAAGITQKNGNTFPLIHAKDIQLGQVEDERLTDKLTAIDAIMREIYGEAPTTLDSYGLASLSAIAAALDNDDTTVDTRITALRMWKTIAIAAQSSAITDLTANTTSIEADTNDSTLTFASANKWIKFAGTDSTNNQLQVAHLVGTISETTATSDLNSSGTFDLPVLSYDEAGHIIGNTITTYTLPYNWRSITTQNSGTSTDDNDLTAVDATIDAASQIDTVKFIAGNQWIKLAAASTTVNQVTTKTVTFAHKHSALADGAHASAWTLAAQTPNFGASFNILVPSVSFTTDKAGHVTAYSYGSSNATVTLPSCSVTDTTSNGNVVTGLGVTASTGAFTTSRANIGTLAITGYAVSYVPQGQTQAQVYNGALQASDSLNVALARLENRILALETTVDTTTTGLVDRVSALEDSINTANTGIDARLTTVENNYLTTTVASQTYQPKGNYQPAGDYQAAGNYVVADSEDPYLKTSSISDLISNAIDDLKANYSITLLPPTVTISAEDDTITVAVNEIEGTLTYRLEKIEGNVSTTVSDSAPASGIYTVTANGTYQVVVTRTYNSDQVSQTSNTVEINYFT